MQVVEFEVVTNFHSLYDPLLILESIGQMLQMALKYQTKGSGGIISPSCFFFLLEYILLLILDYDLNYST